MNERLREVDANLLLSLHALLEERNLTHAGERMTMSQPAMSGALARLRKHFDDELLVRAGRGFELTPLGRGAPAAGGRGGRGRRGAARQPARVRRRHRARKRFDGEHVRVRHDRALRAAHPAAAASRRRAARCPRPRRPSPRQFESPADAARPDRRLRSASSSPADCSRSSPTSSSAWSRATNPWLEDGALTLEDLQAMPHAVAEFAAAGDRRRPLEVELDAKGGLGDRTVLVQVTSLLTLPVRGGRHRHVRVRAVAGWPAAASTCSTWRSPTTPLDAGTDHRGRALAPPPREGPGRASGCASLLYDVAVDVEDERG